MHARVVKLTMLVIDPCGGRRHLSRFKSHGTTRFRYPLTGVQDAIIGSFGAAIQPLVSSPGDNRPVMVRHLDL